MAETFSPRQRQPARVDPLLAGIAAQQFGAFTAGQAMSVGFTAKEVRSHVDRGDWTSIVRGGYVGTDQWVAWGLGERHRARIAAVTLVTGAPTVASHFSAAELLGVPVLHHGGPVHVTRPTWVRSQPYRVLHRADLADDEVSDGPVRMTSPLRTALDVSRLGDLRAAVVTVDGLLAAGLVSQDQLHERVMRSSLGDQPLGKGAAAIRRTFAFASPLAESAGESVSRVAIAASGLPPPQLQVEVKGPRGRYRVDFLWDGGVIGEFDGRSKYDDPDVLYAEKRREDDLRAMGFTVIRWGWDEAYRDFAPVAARIRSAMRRAA